jgi:hypothetical protein
VQVKDMAVHFEGTIIGKKHDSRGYVLSIVVQPDDIPEAILRDYISTRYMIAMVRIGDDELPVAHESTIREHKALAMSHTLCRDQKFQHWMFTNYSDASDYLGEMSDEDRVTKILYRLLDIESRSELKNNKTAMERFFELVDEFKWDKPRGDPWD